MPRKLHPEDFPNSRRSQERIECVGRTIEVLPCRATSSRWTFLPAELTDCSLNGVGLLVPEPMDFGQQFLVKLRAGGRVRLLLYTVQNCAPQDRSRYRIGARFSGFAAQEFDEDLQAVLDGLTGKA